MIDYFVNEQSFEQKLQSALNAYRKLKDSTNSDDVKLIEMMDEDVRDLFDETLP